jgi:hypothetical protein
VELVTPHRTINYHETRKGGQGLVWAVAPLIITLGDFNVSGNDWVDGFAKANSHYYTKYRGDVIHNAAV